MGGLFLHPEGKKPAGYGPDGVDAAALPVEDAGGILLALHNRKVENDFGSMIFYFNIASIVIIKSIYDLRRFFARFSRYGCDISACEVNQVGLLPKIHDLLGRDEIIEL